MGIFNGVASAAGSVERNDSPKVGRCLALLTKSDFSSSAVNRCKKNFFKATCTVVKGLKDEDGRREGEEGYVGNRAGDVVDLFYIDNPQYPSYFVNDLQKFGLSCLGATKSDLVTDVEKAAGAEGTAYSQFEEEFLPAILGINADGSDSGVPGICDGVTLVEIECHFKPRKDGNGVIQTNPDGSMMGRENYSVVRKAAFAEVGDLSDIAMVKAFGSVDNYAQLLQSEV